MDKQSLPEHHLQVLKASLSWNDFKESLVALCRHEGLDIESNSQKSIGAPEYRDEFDSGSKARNSRVIKGLEELLTEGRTVHVEHKVVLLHLAQATASLDGLGSGFLRVNNLDWPREKPDGDLPELDVEAPVSQELEYFLRSRRLGSDDESVLQGPEFGSYKQDAAGDVSKTWVCSEVAWFLEKRQSARHLKELLESADSSQDDDIVDLCCAAFDFRACQKTPKDLFSRIGLTEDNMDEIAAQTLAYWAFCEEVEDVSKTDEEGSLPARKSISSSFTEPVLDRVIAYIHKRSASVDYIPTHIEYRIWAHKGYTGEEVVGRYWNSRTERPTSTCDIKLLERFRAMLERCRIRQDEGPFVPLPRL